MSGRTEPSGVSWITMRWKNWVGRPWKRTDREIGKPNVGTRPRRMKYSTNFGSSMAKPVSGK